MEAKVKSTPAELAAQFVNCKMNCGIEHNPTKILRLLGKGLNDITSLRNYFIEEKERLDKNDKHEFSQWYDKDIVKILDELIDSTPTIGAGLIIVQALKDGHMFRKFSWNNYNKLVAEDLYSLFGEFDSDFRGDITVCHKVGGKYVVIETEQYPFGSKPHTKRIKEKKYYSTEYRKDKVLRTTSTVFDSFEAALFHTMAQSQYLAMNILFEAANKEE